jgi:hypothetical protein
LFLVSLICYGGWPKHSAPKLTEKNKTKSQGEFINWAAPLFQTHPFCSQKCGWYCPGLALASRSYPFHSTAPSNFLVILGVDISLEIKTYADVEQAFSMWQLTNFLRPHLDFCSQWKI